MPHYTGYYSSKEPWEIPLEKPEGKTCYKHYQNKNWVDDHTWESRRPCTLSPGRINRRRSADQSSPMQASCKSLKWSWRVGFYRLYLNHELIVCNDFNWLYVPVDGPSRLVSLFLASPPDELAAASRLVKAPGPMVGNMCWNMLIRPPKKNI